jgi:hypothetical protein
VASTTTAQVPPGSLDTAGISITTATPSGSNPRAGTIYNPITLSAAQPVWFHPMFDGRYLMINSRTWNAATPAGGIGYYSGYTESVVPSWVIVDGASGATASVPNYPVIPFKNLVTQATVTAATSRHPGYLFLLHSVMISGQSQAILQIMSIATSGAVTLTQEEILPTVALDSETVLFDRGLQYADPYMIVYGSDSSGTVYTIRKPWAKIGINTQLNPTTQTHGAPGATEVAWSYYTGVGYSPDSTQLAPLTSADATSLTTQGPISTAMINNQLLITTVADNAGTYTGQVWSSRKGRPITPLVSGIALGSSSAGTYLGGGLQLQPTLSAVTVPSGASAAIPYVVSRKLTADGSDSLANVWGTFPVNV